MPTRPTDSPAETPLAWGYPDITVGFVDMVGFTELCAELPPLSVVTLLDDFFIELDTLCERHRLTAIKTIGDAYMLAGGLAQGDERGYSDRMFSFALEVLELTARHPSVQGTPFEVRIGLATGPVVAGVLRGNRVQIDLWGDTVNLASRLCEQAVPMGLLIDEITYLSLNADTLSRTPMEACPVLVKGRGSINAYRHLRAPRPEASVGSSENTPPVRA